MSADRIMAVAMADPHCGHQVGLTHPDFNYVSDLSCPIAQKFKMIREECYSFYRKTLTEIGTPDIVIVNGDGIEGKGSRSGGTELIANDEGSQIKILKAALAETNCKTICMAYGTAYHVSGTGEDRENDLLVDGTVKKIGSHEFLNIKGFTFDIKHHIGSSSVPHGRATALARDILWNQLWNGDNEMQPLADVMLRAHVHYFGTYGTWYKDRLRMAYTMPALQAMGSKFGARKCSGIVHFGFLVFYITTEGITCVPKITTIRAQNATITVV